jgi:hypothetical protein
MIVRGMIVFAAVRALRLVATCGKAGNDVIRA